MALELKIKVEENCNSLYFFDMTGKYDKKCNETGWCFPNPEITDAESAEFQIYPPKTDDPIVLDVYPDFPVSNKKGYEILPEDLGMDKFVSGIWRFDYLVRVNGVLFTVSCSKLLVEDLKCCVHGKKISVSTDNFDSKEVINSNNLCALFESAIENSCAGKTDEAQKIIDYLYNQCNCSC